MCVYVATACIEFSEICILALSDGSETPQDVCTVTALVSTYS